MLTFCSKTMSSLRTNRDLGSTPREKERSALTAAELDRELFLSSILDKFINLGDGTTVKIL